MKKLLLILSFAFCLNANAQYTKLHDFANAPDGGFPQGDLISDGTFLYGMTQAGGANSYGNIFKILPNGTGYVNLYDFVGNPTDGWGPQGNLISVGNFLYGMTQAGGVNNMGTIFKIMPNGTGYAKLYDFTGYPTDGKFPYGSLVYDGTFLYGTTYDGGASTNCSGNGCGTIFKIMPNGTGYVKLYDFPSIANGQHPSPSSSLVYDGTFLYGTTYDGGANNMGVIFKILPNGTGYIDLLDFAGTANGQNPNGSLISDGTFLYGMTSYGGVNNTGTIFKIMPNGTGYAKLFDFQNATDGSIPTGSVISDGNFLYGMTYYGGVNNRGTIFKIKTDGSGFDTLLAFNGNSNGSNPNGSLLLSSSCLYGMTYAGGTSTNCVGGCGTVFKYCLGSTGIGKEVNNNAQVNIYPNPTSDQLFVDANTTDKLSVDLFDVNGRRVFSQSVSDNSNIDVTTLNEGVYSLTIKTVDRVINKKLVIIR